MTALLSAGCAIRALPSGEETLQFPVLRGWFDGTPVLYVTTDVSDAQVAKNKGANFAPRLGFAVPPAGTTQPGTASSVDKVYAVTNFVQGSVFASAPVPLGHGNRDKAYSPLWQMVKVTWAGGSAPRVLMSEEAVLNAAEAGQVTLETTRVVLNCPIVVARGDALPGVSIGRRGP